MKTLIEPKFALLLLFIFGSFTLKSQTITIDGAYSPCPSALGAGDGEWDNPAVNKIVNPNASSTCQFTTIYGYADETTFYGAMNVGNSGAAYYYIYLNTDCDAMSGDPCHGGADHRLQFQLGGGNIVIDGIYEYTGDGTIPMGADPDYCDDDATGSPGIGGEYSLVGSGAGYELARGDFDCTTTTTGGSSDFVEFSFPIAAIFDPCDSDGCGSVGITAVASQAGGSENSNDCNFDAVLLDVPVNEPPTAVIGEVPPCIYSDTEVCLDGSQSTDPDGDILTYEWDLDYDGMNFNVDETGVNICTFFAEGTYTIALRVTDEKGCSDLAFNAMDQIIIVSADDKLTCDIIGTDVSCNGGTDGSVDATITGGTAPYDYSWSDGLMEIGMTEDLNNLPAGTYILTVTDAMGCTSTCMYTIMEPDPIGANDAELTECEVSGGEAVFDLTSTKSTVNGGGGLTYTYYEDMSATTVITDSMTYLSTSGTVYVVVSDGSCTDIAEITLNVTPAPTANDAMLTECETTDGNADFTLEDAEADVNGGADISYAYYSDEDATNGIGSPYTAMDGTTVYVVVTDDITLCTDTAQITLNVTPAPTANDAMLTECETLDGNADFTLEDAEGDINGGAGISYAYYSDEAATIDISSPYIAMDGTIVYVVVTDDNTLCTDTAEITLNVTPAPIANDASLTECETSGGDADFTLEDAEADVNGGADISYAYYSDVTATTGIVSPYTAMDGTIVYVVVTDDNTLCTDTAEITLNVTPAPIANDASLTECETTGGDADFTLEDAEGDINGGAGISYAYYSDEDATNGIGSPYTVMDGTIVYVVVTDDNTLCTDTVQITLHVTPAPTANEAMLTECETTDGNADFTLEDTEADVNGGADISYAYYSDEDATNGIGSPYTAMDGTTVYVVVTDDIMLCTDTAQITLNVTPAPTANDAMLTECETTGGNADFTLEDAETDVNGGAGISYAYYSDEAATTGISSPYTTMDGVIVYVVVTDDNTLCTDTAQITLNVTPAPTTNDASLTECETTGGDADFTLENAETDINGGAGISYAYYSDEAATTGISSPYTAMDGTTVYVVVTDDNTMCTDTAAITLNVTPAPTANDASLTECETTGGDADFTLEDAEGDINGGAGISYSYYSDEDATNGIGSPYTAMDGTIVYVVVTDDNTLCTDTVQITLNVTPAPTANDVILTECETTGGNADFNLEDAEADVNGGAGINYAYYSNEAATTGISSPYTAMDGTIVFVVVTDGNTLCTDTAQITLNVTPAPTANDAMLTECETTGGNADFTLEDAETDVNGGAGISYAYYSDEAATTGISSPYTAMDGVIVYVVVTDDNTLCTDTAQITLNVTPAPTANDASLTECETTGGDADFTLENAETDINGGAGISYAYYSDEAATTGISSPYTAMDGTTVYVVVTDDNTMCTDTAAITLNVTPAPTANDASLTECETTGGDADFTLEDAEGDINGGAGISYSYYSDEDATNGIGSPYTAMDGTIVYVVVTDDNTLCTDTVQISLNVTPAPTANDAMLTECETTDGNADFTLEDAETDINGGAGISYAYYSDEAATTGISSPYTAMDGTIVYVVVTDDNTLCTDTAAITLNVISAPTANDAILTECETTGGNADFNLEDAEADVNGGAGINYAYYSNEAATTGISSPYTAMDGTIVFVVVTDGNTLCTDTAQITLNVTPAPTANDAMLTECETTGGNADFTLEDAETDVNGGAGISYAYYSDEAATTGISSPYTAMDGTTVYVVVTDDNTMCTDTAAITLNVTPAPTANDASLTECETTGGDADFTLEDAEGDINGGAGISYAYYSDEAATTGISSPYTAMDGTIVYVVVTDDNTLCTDTAAITLNVISAPTANDAILTECETTGGNADFNLEDAEADVNGGAGINYAYFSDATAITSISSPYTAMDGTIVYVVVSAGATMTCTDTAQITLNVTPAPTANDASLTECEITGGNADFTLEDAETDVNGGAGISYAYYSDEAATTGISSPYTAMDGTTVYVVVTDDNTMCTDTAAITLNVTPAPTANDASQTECETTGGNADFTLEDAEADINGGAGISYAYYSDEAATTGIGSPYTAMDGTTVYVVVTDDNTMCTDTASITLNVTPAPTANDASLTECEITGGNADFTLEDAEADINGGAGISYAYYSDEAATTGISSPYTAMDGTTVYVVVTDGNTMCTDTASITLNVTPAPTANDASLTECEITGGNADFTLEDAEADINGGAGISYAYFSDATAITSISSPYTAMDGTIVYVVVSAGATMTCTDTAQITLNVTPAPTANDASLTECETSDGNADFTLEDSETDVNGGAGINYAYFSDAMATTGIVSPYTAMDGTIVYVVVTDGNTLCTDTAQITLNVTPAPTANDAMLTECETTGGDAEFTLEVAEADVNGGAGISYAYYSDATATTSIGSPYTAMDGTTVYVVVTDDNTTCTDTAAITLNVNPVSVVTIEKDILSGPELTGNVSNEYKITYRIVINNTGIACPVTYDLTDTLKFGTGASIDAVMATYEGGDGFGGTDNTGSFDGQTDYLISEDEMLEPGQSDTFNVMVTFTVNFALVTDESADCNLTEGESGTGLLNCAAIGGGVPIASDSVCSEIPQPECLPLFGGLDAPNCSNFAPTVFDNGDISFGAPDVLSNHDRAMYPIKVTFLNQWDGVIAEFILNDFCETVTWNACEYLGRSLEFSVMNDVGTCNDGELNLSGNPPLIFTSAYQNSIPSILNTRSKVITGPNISESKINVYCGNIPDPSDHVPMVINPCKGIQYTPTAQPDWIMPIPCDEASDTAEIIFRTWEVFDQQGNLFTMTDTIVVFRLPLLTPAAFVDSGEEVFYCELEPVAKEGDLLKQYASWKQPVGLHDYEQPYAKLRGLVYEIPATIILAGLVNASSQGPDVLTEYLECVILRKANGVDSVTIGDIVSGDYIDELIANATQEQKIYGFLSALIAGNENPIVFLLGASFEFYPYLLLQEGDWILSEGGVFERVDVDWFYNGNGNSPYWFAGGWPSIYGKGDGISYCDVGVGREFGCIRVQVPSLTIENGMNNEDACDVICLTIGNHCGITIKKEEIADWSQTHTGKLGTAGSCPKTRGVDTWITQTCWAETPNYCASDFEFACSEPYIPASESIVTEYECTDKAVKIHISQWQTLIDTIGPIFDFCYPYRPSLPEREGEVNGIGEFDQLNQALRIDEKCFTGREIWDHEEIQRSIRAGEVYDYAQRWEYCNPTTYRVSSHDCKAEVFVPSVKVVDNCSGVHSVKAMVELVGGTRSVALELTSTETRILANGDTCNVYTYSHLSDPIIIPFDDCDDQLTEVRYEAADNCWNQSEWYKYIRIIDDVPPTVVANREVNVTLNSKTEWIKAGTFDEGSWDNCAIDLRLVRRSDWINCIDICTDSGENAPYKNWVDILDDLGVSRDHAIAAVSGTVVGNDKFAGDYVVDELKTFLNAGEIEKYYFNQLVWMWEDDERCGPKVVHGWLFALASYIAENCSVPDEHGNTLKVNDLETIFDNLIGTPGYGNEIALLGGGWSQSVPFKCEDACEEVTAELLVMDYCCNWGIGWSTVFVEDKGNARLVTRLPDMDISCEAYSIFYKDIVEDAAAFGENGSVSDTSDAFEDLDRAFGAYIKTWVNNQNQPTDIDGNLLDDSVLAFDYWNVICEERSETEKVAVVNHDNSIDWITKVSKVTYLDSVPSSAVNGIIGINCAATCEQDVWVDLDDCGKGTITRRFFITGGCGPKAQTWEVEQVINVRSACGMRESMFDLPVASIGTKEAPICLPQALSKDFLPDTIGNVTLKPHLQDKLCNSFAIGSSIKELEVLEGTGIKKYIIDWNVIDWCADHTSSTRTFTYTQEVIATIDPACELNSAPDSGDMSIVSGRVMTELNSGVKEVDVRAVLGQGSPLNIRTSGNGSFNFSIRNESKVSIIPSKNTGFSEGVTTADLIDIQRHILQKQALDSKYKLIAADVNGNGLVEGLDVLELRRLVLNPNGVLTNNSSWRFFENLTGREMYEEDKLTSDQTIHFTGVKIGDVNLSGDPARSSRSAKGQLHLNVADRLLKGGEVYHIDVRSDNFEDIRGLQYTMGYSDAYIDVVSILPGALNITENHYLKYAPGLLTASWSESDGVSVGSDEILFTIVVKSKVTAPIRDIMSLNNRVAGTEAYTGSDELKDVALHFDRADNGFTLYQNIPNPYTGETVIGFELPESGETVITIYDVTGRVIKRIEGEFNAGYNEVRVTSTDLGVTGVLYYQLDTDRFTATKKMIVVE